jgi:hypothetical protein
VSERGYITIAHGIARCTVACRRQMAFRGDANRPRLTPDFAVKMQVILTARCRGGRASLNGCSSPMLCGGPIND